MKKKAQKVLCTPNFEINDEHGCLHHHGISESDLLDLSGGIPINDEFPLKCIIKSATINHVRVEIKSSIYTCERSFDFTTRIIRNDYLRVHTPGKGIGRALFINQLLAARRLNFQTIKLHATGGDAGSEWNGFYTWGRFGFTMESRDQLLFEMSQKEEGRDESTLSELLSTQEGRAFWIENGVSWAGKFETHPQSENSDLLNDYLFEKKLNPL